MTLSTSAANEEQQATTTSVKLCTRQARALHQQLKTKIKHFLLHDDSSSFIDQFALTTDAEEIRRRQQEISGRMQQLTPEKSKIIQEHLLTALTFTLEAQKKCNTIVLACGDVSTYTKFKKAVGNLVPVSLVQRDQDLFDVVSYEQVRLIPGEEGNFSAAVEDIENVVIFTSTSLDEVFPEQYVLLLEQQQEALQALQHLQSLLTIEIPSHSFENNTTDFSVESIRQSLEKDVTALQECIDNIVEQSQFSGSTFSKIIQEETSLLKELSQKQQDSIQQFQIAQQQKREKKLLFPFSHSIHISATGKAHVDEESFMKEVKTAKVEQKEKERLSRTSLAKEAKKFIEKFTQVQEELHTLDLFQAIKQFHEKYALTLPSLQEKGIEFVYGKNMHLKNAAPVAYHLGKDQPIAILTGANSGGKTTLMELLAQIQLLTQMGFGVPAREAKVGLVEHIYYFSKSKGTLGAGAFETMLGEFAKLAKEKTTAKLILADEIESVTEPDIAARIIKGILLQLQKHSATTTLLVTHVGRELQKLSCPARFDGIEAKGLDKDFKLIVERNPTIGKIARSTPQLIIERLAKTKQDSFYKELLNEIR